MLRFLTLTCATALTVTAVAVTGLTVTAQPALAQNQSDTDAGAGTGTGVTGPTLDLGQPVSTGPRPGERYSKQKFDDWDLACIKTDTDKDPCSMLQILTDSSGNPIAEVSLFRLKEGGQAVAGATIIVPLETLLPAQLTIAVDGGGGKRYNYTFCNPIGCIAQIGLTAEDVAAFKRGAAATVSLVPAPAPDQRIDLNLSLKGFTAAYDVVDVIQN